MRLLAVFTAGRNIAMLSSLLAANPAYAAGSGTEIAQPSTAASVQVAVKSVPSVLESSSVDQAVNSVVDVVKVICSTTALTLLLGRGHNSDCRQEEALSKAWQLLQGMACSMHTR